MNIKQQLEQVIGNFRDIAADLASIGRTAFSNAVSRETANLSAIVEQMEADEQAIVEEVNKRWPQGKPQPDDTFVGAAPQVPDGMVLVPLTPTRNMIEAGIYAQQPNQPLGGSGNANRLRRRAMRVYGSMLSAAAKEEGAAS